jgi:ribosomal protein RSM22 (predicted rRNA methylase)
MVVSLPAELQSALEQETRMVDRKLLMKAAAELSQLYRKGAKESHSPMDNPTHCLAYAISRMPATYAANTAVMQQLPTPPATLLDLGSGPATGAFAAHSLFPGLTAATCYEKERGLITLGKRLSSHLPFAIDWIQGRLQPKQFEEHALVLLSYSLGEMTQWEALLAQAWGATGQYLVLIEPGTPRGFERVRAARQLLLQQGAHLVAPCPHCAACPLPANDWCHFSQRTERSALHRDAKGGSLPYEDEKFSYVILAKEPVSLPAARILRHPLKRSGHVQLQLCTQNGIATTTVSRRSGPDYSRARKAQWGDRLDFLGQEQLLGTSTPPDEGGH